AGIPRLVEQAVLDRRPLAVADGGRELELELDPLALAPHDGGWYLVGWRLPSGPAGTVPVDRIAALHPSGRPAPTGLPVTGERFAELVREPARFPIAEIP